MTEINLKLFHGCRSDILVFFLISNTGDKDKHEAHHFPLFSTGKIETVYDKMSDFDTLYISACTSHHIRMMVVMVRDYI